MKEHIKTPPLFPCANKVHVPHVGADKGNVKSRGTFDVPRPNLKSFNSPGVSKQYVKQISSDLSFSEGVVRDRCFHLLPYDEKYLQEALDISDIVSPRPRAKDVMGRHNNRAADTKHIPCHIKKRNTHRLQPMKRKILEKALELHQAALKREQFEAKSREESSVQHDSESIFLTETTKADQAKETGTEEEPGWDEALLTMVSSTTARWIISHRTSPGIQQEKLTSTINKYHGIAPKDDKAELVRDNVSEGDPNEKQDLDDDRKWKKQDETLLDKVRELTKQLGKPTDPYNDDSAAAFYRLPAGVRRAQKYQQREEAGAINTTAHNIQVKPFEAPPPPTLRDHMNPAAGRFIYDADNVFQQERLIGTQQIYDRLEDNDKITTEYHNKYHKKLQRLNPKEPKDWYPLTETEKKRGRQDAGKVRRLNKGLHRWYSLPEPVDDTAEKLSLALPGTDMLMARSPDPESRKQVRNNGTLVQIVNDWRGKWHLDMRYADATPEDLIRDMADMHPHIRLKAITTCARAAEYRPPPKPGIQLDNRDKQIDHVKLLPENLFVALQCCMEDEHEQVRRAAAIALYTLERPVERAEEIMRKTLKEAKSVDRWTAAQCLAYYGECDSEVVGELVSQMLYTEDSIRYERAATLLAKLSESSTLVHSMLAEQLNSSSWRHRVMVCKVMPKLHGHINRDIVNKLTHLMWNDWHAEVRKAAAHALGKTGHGKDVHDELREKILRGNERSRVEAVQKVGHLGIMTAKLLPAFLECFTDSYVSVRMEACHACNILRIKDPQVLDKLVFLATYDAIWRVKALAFQAMGTIGEITQPIRTSILWALRYEDQPGVRAEACHTAVRLGLKDLDLAQILQERFLVETSPVVKYELTQAFAMFGISPTEDMDMVAQIKNEVRKLCTRNRICKEIAVNEKAAGKQANLERMIAHPSPPQVPVEKRAPRSYRRPLSRRDSIGKDITEKASPRNAVSAIVEAYLSQEDAALDQEVTALTPAADEEVQLIMERDDTTYTTVTGIESRPDTGYSKSNKTVISEETLDIVTDETEKAFEENEGEETENGTEPTHNNEIAGQEDKEEEIAKDVESEQKSEAAADKLSSSRMTSDTRNEDPKSEVEGKTKDGGEENDTTPENPRRTPVFGQSDQYVEVTAAGEDSASGTPPANGTDGVVRIKHISPPQSLPGASEQTSDTDDN